jgi:hypothetical protein
MPLGIVGYGIDDFHVQVFDALVAGRVDREVGRVADAVAGNHRAAFVDGFRQLLRCGAAVAGVVFDAEVAVRAAGVMTGRENDAAEGAVLADHATGRGRGQDAALPQQHTREAVGGRHFQDDLDRAAIMETAVAAKHQCFPCGVAERVEHALDEVFEITMLLEDRDLLAQSGSPRALAGDRGRCYSLDCHVRSYGFL